MQTVIGSSDQTLHPQASTQFSRTGSFHSQSQDVEAQLSTAGNRETLVLEGKLPPLLRKNTENIPYELHKERLAKRVHIKNYVIAFISEFLGTVQFLFCALAIATQANRSKEALQNANSPTSMGTQELLFSSLGFGFSLLISVWVWFRVSGGLQNPALTLSLILTGTLTWQRGLILSIAQYAGGIASAALVTGLLPYTINARTDLGEGTTVVQGFFIEFFMTAWLIFTVLLMAGEKHKATFLAPVCIGLCLFVAEMLATNLTGGSLNPARSLGPNIISGTWTNTWLYFVPQYASAILVSGIYRLLKMFRYESVVPGQDGDDSISVVRDVYGSVIGAVTTVHQSEFHFVKRSSSEDSPLEMNNALHHPGQPFAHVDGETQDSNTIEKSYIDPTGFRARGASAASNGTRVVHPEVVYGQNR